jgi:hypothetical protein
MTLSFYLKQTTKKNQGRQEDLDRSAGNIDKFEGSKVPGSPFKGLKLIEPHNP